MKPADQIDLAPYFDKSENLVSQTAPVEWERPTGVELRMFLDVLGDDPDSIVLPPTSALRIYRRPGAGNHVMARAKPDLLERFMDLAESTDEGLRKFAARFGALWIFRTPDPETPLIAWFEHCDVWRYFARTMLALLKIAARSRQDGPATKEDWDAIGRLPAVLSNWDFPDERVDENFWIATAHYVAKGSNRNRKCHVRLLNTLLALGRVRPWVLWPANSGRARVVYSSPRLVSYLALQLCLKIGGLNAFVTCHHCRKEYTPPQRAPKAGQRNFCPECRDLRIPKTYALRDYRERKRSKRNGEEEK